jgi:hypothetical protein
MTPDGLQSNYYFGGGGDTLITPAGLVIFLVGVCLILTLPRKYVIVPLLAVGLLTPLGEKIVISVFHLMIYRLIILVGWIRIVCRRSSAEPIVPRLNKLDKAFLAWAVANAVMYVFLWGPEAIVNKLGFLYTTLGAYFLLRHLIRDREDVIRTIRVLSLVMFVIAVFMFREHQTGHNSFATIGGVAEISEVRDGSIRAKGPFSHSIIAGTVGAMLIPLFVALWREGKRNRLVAGGGLLAAILMMISCASSTPIMTSAAGILALCFWPMRQGMRKVRWGIVFALIGIQMFMKVPIWFLLGKASGVLGGTGWHRAVLIDEFVHRFFEWWLIGTRNNANWGLDMWDCINAYVNAGVEGGLVTFVLFLALVTYAYKAVGKARRFARRSGRDEYLIWCIGSSLFANTVAFFGIIYFDQSVIVWYALLVMICAIAKSVGRPIGRPTIATSKQLRIETLLDVDSEPATATTSGVQWSE